MQVELRKGAMVVKIVDESEMERYHVESSHQLTKVEDVELDEPVG